MSIDYRINFPISTDQFIAVLQASTLGGRRPVADRACMAGMVGNSSLMVTAWVDDRLVGVARSLTDFHYACYLSDLAVDVDFQRQGIGTGLLRTTQSQLAPRCKLILVAAPDANDYYAQLGFESNPRCWILAGSLAVRDTKS